MGIKNQHITRNIKNWAESCKYERISNKLKDLCFKMSNFSYCHPLDTIEKKGTK